MIQRRMAFKYFQYKFVIMIWVYLLYAVIMLTKGWGKLVNHWHSILVLPMFFAILIMLIPIFAQATAQSNNTASSTYYGQYAVLKWGSHGTADGELLTPWDVAVDSHDNVYVADEYNRVSIFTSDGHFITKWKLSFQPWEIKIDSNDNVYVLSDNTSPTTVNKFTTNGKLVQVWGNDSSNDVHIPIISEDGFHSTLYPLHVVIDRQNNVHLIYSDGETLVYSSNGQRISDFQPVRPLAFDSKGNFYEGSYYDYMKKSWAAFDFKGNVYNSDTPTILKLDPDGNQIMKWKSNKFPYTIAIDSHDNVYIVDVDPRITKVFSPDGDKLELLTNSLKPQNSFYPVPANNIVGAAAIAIDSHDNVYVVGGSEDYPGVIKFLPLSNCPANCQTFQTENPTP